MRWCVCVRARVCCVCVLCVIVLSGVTVVRVCGERGYCARVCVVIVSVGVRAMGECGGYVCVYGVVSDVLRV